VISVLPLDGLKALYEKEEEIKECVRTLYKAIQSPLFRVSIQSVYLTYVSCCYVMCIIVSVNSCDK
jgi:hypothetical protein